MTLGQKLKNLRNKAGLTQKELADRLHVTFQTVSKWENDTNEPDFSTLKELSKILDCSIDYLFDEGEEKPAQVAPTSIIVPTVKKVQLGVCRDCSKPIYEGDSVHQVNRISSNGTNEIVTICDECFTKHEEYIARRAKEIEESTKALKPKDPSKVNANSDLKALMWGGIIALIIYGIGLASCIVNFETTGWVVTIVGPLVLAYLVMSTIYCIFSGSYIGEVFLEIASWSIKFPGVIFTFDLEGLIFLIAVKLIFLVLGFFLSVFVFLFALAVAAALSAVSFIPVLIYNRNH